MLDQPVYCASDISSHFGSICQCIDTLAICGSVMSEVTPRPYSLRSD